MDGLRRGALALSLWSFALGASARAQDAGTVEWSGSGAETGSSSDAARESGQLTDGGAPADVSAADLDDIARALGSDASERNPEAHADHEPTGAIAVASGAFKTLELSLITDVAAAAFTSEAPLQTGGHDPRGNGFTLQQLELSARSVIDPYFRFDANIVFNPFGVEIEEAYATTLDLPGRLQVRAGQFLTRFGRQNPTHLHDWSFVDQPFALGRIFGSENNRGLGGELSWLSPLPWYLELIGSVTDARGEETARSFFGESDARVLDPLDLQLTGALEQFFELSDDWSLLVGLSGATGPNASGHRTRSDVYGIDVYVKFRPITAASVTELTLQTELFYRRRQVPEDLLEDWNGYSQLLWHFDRRWETGVRYEYGTPAFGTGGLVVDDPLDPEWVEARERASLVLSFLPTEFSRLRLQTSVDLPRWRDRPEFSAFLALEIVAGAHGAHTF